LQFNIDEEKSSRAATDINPSNRISDEVIGRENAISGSYNTLSGLVEEVRSAVNSEIMDREWSVQQLENAISQMVSDRENALTAEQDARSAADEDLSGNIIAERNSRIEEVKVERERIDAMLSGSTIDLNQLHELVTAYQTSDNDILVQIGNITSSINLIQGRT